MSYDLFSQYYDSLTLNAEYQKRADYCDKILKQNGINYGILLDLGCGTGSMCIEMNDRGYDVIGIDISVGMLMKAREKCFGKDILLLNQSMDNLDLYGTVDCCISILDCINHLPDRKSVQKCFKDVSLFMNHKGIFIFDVNTIYKHKKILANNSFVIENDTVFCAWQNTLNKDNSVDINLDFFYRDGEIYYRDSESFREQVYSDSEISEMLTEAGFDIINIFDDLTFNEVKETSEKAVFVCRKQ